MSARGFTLVELLVGIVVALLVAGAALILAGAARTSLVVEPAAGDVSRRVREAADVLAATVANAGGEIGFGTDLGSLATVVPVVRLLPDGGTGRFTGVSVLRAVQGGRGRLTADQAGPGGSLLLDAAPESCPQSGTACGFRDGDAAVVFDGRGHFDVFIVSGAAMTPARVTPQTALAYSYPAGSRVAAVQGERLMLAAQGDGSSTLTRITTAGAREPLVDGVNRLELHAWGRAAPPALADGSLAAFADYGLPPLLAGAADPEGIFSNGSHCMAGRDSGLLASLLLPRTPDGSGLAPLPLAELDDGPWCPHDDAPERFDADWFRVRRVDVRLSLEVLVEQLRGGRGALFARGGSAAQSPTWWVRDRELFFSVAVGR